jgi:phage regulator Rha-like protein
MPRVTRKKQARAAAKNAGALIPLDRIEQTIYRIHGQRVMLDTDLAAFYGVETKALNRAVKRNQARLPEDFCFQLSEDETDALRCQIGTSNAGRGGRRYRPFAFTEHGAIMAATVLRSKRAVQVSVLVVRAFVRLRQILAEHHDLARKIEALEREFVHKTDEHEAHIRRIYEILDDLMNPSAPPRKGRIGFVG